jgi:hypothetical protein
MSLRSSVIRLAHDDPTLRPHLLSLLVASKPEQLAKYKGKTYRVLFLGPTKYGERARLQFMDGSKDFWVDARLVDVVKGTPQQRGRRRPGGRYECPECGDWVTPGTRCWETGMIH